MNYDWLDKLLVTLALCALLSIGMVKLVGPEPVRTTGVILSYMLMGIAIIAVPSFLFAFVAAQINSFKWNNRAKAVSLQRKQVVTASHSGGVVIGDVGKKRFQNFLGHPKAAQSRMAALGKAEGEAEAEPQGDALQLASRCDRGMIFGGTDAGKTYFAKRLAKRKLDDGHVVIVLDPKHYDRRKPWPEGVRLAGTGDRLEEMEWAFDWIEREKERRGQDMDNVDIYPFVTVIFDELNEVLVDRPDFGKAYVRVLRKYREYRFGVWIMGQSDRVSEIGLEKRADLKQCFNARFDIRYNPTSGARWIDVDFMSPEPGVTCPAIQPTNITRGARPDTDWAFRHDHEGDSGRYASGYAPRGTRANYSEKTSGGASGGVSGHNRPRTKSPGTPVGPPRIIHDPNLEPFLFEGEPDGPDIIEVSDARIAEILRAARSNDSLRSICTATGRTPGGKQNSRIKNILKKYDPATLRRVVGR